MTPTKHACFVYAAHALLPVDRRASSESSPLIVPIASTASGRPGPPGAVSAVASIR